MAKLLTKREGFTDKIFHILRQSPFILLAAFTCACASVFTLVAMTALQGSGTHSTIAPYQTALGALPVMSSEQLPNVSSVAQDSQQNPLAPLVSLPAFGAIQSLDTSRQDPKSVSTVNNAHQNSHARRSIKSADYPVRAGKAPPVSDKKHLSKEPSKTAKVKKVSPKQERDFKVVEQSLGIPL